MAIRKIEQVSCSLNLGLIYSLTYSYSPDSGVSISINFVNESGIYNEPVLIPMKKVFISIGSANFLMFPVTSDIDYAPGQRTIKVDFMDEMYALDKYYVSLPNRGCGQNVYTLGSPVDNRSDAVKIQTAIDRVAQQIANFTQFPDYEYTFNEFLAILRKKFNVSMLASIDDTIRHDFTGSFRDVLDAWCQFYNLSFFFENGIIKIFDPTKLVISLPSKPIDAITYRVSQDIRGTYGKTVCNWFQQDGKEFALNQTNNNDGPLYIRSNTLFPAGYEFNLTQTAMDINQVIAAAYGQHFWFLYNYWKGSTATECGWQTLNSTTIDSALSIVKSTQVLNGNIAIFDENIFNQKFEAYQKYGQEIAGRWYLSTEMNEIATDQNFQWFDETEGQIFDFTHVEDRAIKLDFLTPTNSDTNTILETVVNKYYPGVNYVGNRIVYKDERKIDWATVFAYSATPAIQTAISNLVEGTFQNFFSIQGSSSMDFSQLVANNSNGEFLAYTPGIIPQALTDIFVTFPSKEPYFSPRFTSIPIKGISNNDYTSLKAAQSEPDDIDIVSSNQGPTVVTNTSVIKTVQRGNYTVYYDKYTNCKSASSSDSYFGYKFEPHQVSSDNQVGIIFTKQANNTYRLNRDYGFINQLINNPYLGSLAQPHVSVNRGVTFSLNYFYPVPGDFLSNGLVAMDISVGDAGITSSYTFSNSILQPRNFEKSFSDYEQRVRNSQLRTFYPDETIT